MSEETNNLRLPYLMSAQAQKHVTHNEALRLLDDIVQLGVVSRTASEAPSAPTEGSRYLVPEAAIGEWTGKSGQIAGFQDGAWQFHVPREGWLCWVQEEQILLTHSNGNWQAVVADTTGASQFGVNTQADAINRLSVKSQAVLISHEDDPASTGDVRLSLNKNAVNDTTSLLFQTGFSGRAEMGLAGEDAFSVKVSADGAIWKQALVVDPDSGAVSFPFTTINGQALPPGGTTGQIIGKLSAADGDYGWIDTFTTTPVDAGTRHLYERELGTLPKRPLVPSYNNGSVNQGGDRRWTADPGGDCWFIMPISAAEIASGKTYVEMRVDEGNFSQAYLEQMNGNTVLAGSKQDLLVERDRYLLRQIPLLPNATSVRVRLRNIGTTQAVVFTAPGIGIGEPATLLQDVELAAVDQLLSDAGNQAMDIFSITTASAVIGNAPQVVGNRVTLEAGALCNLTVPMAGEFEVGDTYLILFRTSQPLRQASFTPHSGNVGGGGSAGQWREIGNGLFALEGTVNTGDGAAPSYGILRIDNRALMGLPEGSVEVFDLWMTKNPVGLPSQLRLPGVVRKAFTELGISKFHVDPAGNDTASGSRSQPLATIAEALNRGAAEILLRRDGVHRMQETSLSGSIRFSSFSEAGDVQARARVLFSQAVTVAELSATADADVYFRVATEDPKGVWQASPSGLVRLGVAGANGKPYMADSEATVGQNAGSWWYGNGSLGQGIYLHPLTGYDASTSFEIPQAGIGLTVQNCQQVVLDQVELSCAVHSVLRVVNSSVEARRSRFAHSGGSDAVQFANSGYSWWRDENCEFADAGDDGFGTDGNINSLSIGSRFIDNVADGFAPHNLNNTCRLIDCAFENNGKQGFVSIGQGTFRLSNCRARANFSTDILFTLNDFGVPSLVELSGCTAPVTALSCAVPTQLEVRLVDHRGAVSTDANATIEGLRVSGGQDLLTINGGTALVSDAALNRGNRGLRVNGGLVTLASSRISQCQTGMEILGGAVEIDAGSSVNVFGNATDFANVPTEQSTKAVSYPVV